MVMRAPPLPVVGGLDPMSLTAWEGRVSAVLYLRGCNFACPACDVPHLVPMPSPLRPELGAIPLEAALSAVHQRRRWLDALVVAGGEPTLHDGLPDLLKLLRDLGLPLRLHTNGSWPEVLRTVLEAGDVQSVAMTVRGPLDPTYSLAAGTKVRLAAVYESVELLLRHRGEHEFHVPWLPGHVEARQVEAVVRMLAGARRVVLRTGPRGAPGVRTLRQAARAAGHFVDHLVIAGRPGEDFGSAARSPRVAS
jgi:pyruvate formate lyase activating enzyme